MTRCYSVKDNGGEDDDDSRVDELVPLQNYFGILSKFVFVYLYLYICICIYTNTFVFVYLYLFIYKYICIRVFVLVPEWPLIGDCHGVSNCASEPSHP